MVYSNSLTSAGSAKALLQDFLTANPADRAVPIWDTAGLGAEGREKMTEPHGNSVLLLRSAKHDANFMHQSTSYDQV